jgi:hypothetical protein
MSIVPKTLVYCDSNVLFPGPAISKPRESFFIPNPIPKKSLGEDESLPEFSDGKNLYQITPSPSTSLILRNSSISTSAAKRTLLPGAMVNDRFGPVKNSPDTGSSESERNMPKR